MRSVDVGISPAGVHIIGACMIILLPVEFSNSWGCHSTRRINSRKPNMSRPAHESRQLANSRGESTTLRQFAIWVRNQLGLFRLVREPGQFAIQLLSVHEPCGNNYIVEAKLRCNRPHRLFVSAVKPKLFTGRIAMPGRRPKGVCNVLFFFLVFWFNHYSRVT